MLSNTMSILREVQEERKRQIAKFGDQQTLTVLEWLAILGEENGEACQAAVDYHFTPPDSPGIQRNELLHLRYELIQTAAVAAAMIQSIDNFHLPRAEAECKTDS